MSAEPLELALPKRFELVRHLGSGGMGAVYEAFDHERGAHIALKTLWSSRPDALLHLKNEFRALQDVRHRNLVHLLELVEEKGQFFVLMELVVGRSFVVDCRPGAVFEGVWGLSETRGVPRPAAGETERWEEPRSTRDGAGQLREARLRSTLAQLAEGICALHDRGKLHRDIKPANVLVTAEGRVVLVDFGLAHDVSASPWAGAGTEAFMAPEQAARQTLTPATDWYSVGVMLYLALTGRLPFEGPALQRKKLAGPQPIATLRDAPRDLAELALELLDPDPARRPDGRVVLARLGRADRIAAPAPVLPFLGRVDELSQLTRAFERSRDAAVLALVVGDSGLGKSALVDEWLLRITRLEPPPVVLRGRCYERELVPYKAFDGIVDALSQFLARATPAQVRRWLPRDAALLARVFPVLAHLEAQGPSVPELAEPQELRARAFAAMRELLRNIAEDLPLVLFIDDLQWADADSHLLLADLWPSTEPAPLLLVATARPPQSANDPVATLSQRLSGVVEIPLLPLGFADSRALAAQVLGNQPALAAAVAQEAGGYPLFLQALAEHAKHGGQLRLGGVRLEDAIFSRLERVEPAGRLLLELIALAGVPLPSEIARRAAGLEQVDYAASLASLRVLRLARTSFAPGHEPVEPYHDRIRESLLARLPREQRRDHHQRLAAAMAAAPSDSVDPRAFVHHLEGAGRPAEAAEKAEQGARRAEAALAFDQAAEMYRTALRLRDGADSGRLRLGLAEALTNSGHAAEAAAAYVHAAAGATPEDRLAFRRRAADHLLRSGHLQEGIGILAEVLRESGDALMSQRRSLATTLWQRFRLKHRGLTWTPTAASAVPVGLLPRIDAYHAVGVSLALIDPVRGSAFEARALGLALEAGEPLRLAPALLMEAGYEASGGSKGLAHAARLVGEAERIAELTQDAYVVAICRMMRGFVQYHAAEFAGAVGTLSEMELAFRKLKGTYFEQAFCHCFRLICMRNQGRWGELQRGFSEWVREAQRRGDKFTEASLRFNLNGVWLARDEPDEALRDLRRVTWIPPAGGYHVQHWYEQQARNEIDLYAGSVKAGLLRMRGEMRALSRSFILRIRLHRTYARWQVARLILANVAERQAPASSLGEVRAIEKQLFGEKIGFATCVAELVGAGRAHLLGRQDLALQSLEAALATARTHALFHCYHAAANQLATLVGGSRGQGLAQAVAAWAQAQDIKAPGRLLASLSPGF